MKGKRRGGKRQEGIMEQEVKRREGGREKQVKVSVY